MILFIKCIVKKTPLYIPLRGWFQKKKIRKQLTEWELEGKPVPPPHVFKQQTLNHYKKLFKLKILVETGTYYGDMVESMKNHFDYIYSIELSKKLFEKAKQRFEGVLHIELIYGDSGLELGKVIKKLDKPTLFWLDGHYSGGLTARGQKDTPIFEELEHIFNTPTGGHVILIDDARCFGSEPNYPSILELSEFIKSKNSNVNILVQDDIIRVTPAKSR